MADEDYVPLADMDSRARGAEDAADCATCGDAATFTGAGESSSSAAYWVGIALMLVIICMLAYHWYGSCDNSKASKHVHWGTRQVGFYY